MTQTTTAPARTDRETPAESPPPVGRGNSAAYLADLYAGLGSQKNDFRNYNLNRLIAALVEGDSVLDIGCGSGALITVLHRMGKDASGIEPNQALIDVALQRDPGLHLYRASGDAVDTLGRRFETITIIDVLEHIEDDAEQVARMRRALVPGGQLIVLVPAFQFLFGKRDVSAGHYRRYSKRRLVRLLEDAGFEVQTARHWNAIGFLPYLFAERILRMQLKGDIRTERAKGPFKRAFIWLLHAWYRKVENNLDLRFGLSVIVSARSPEDDQWGVSEIHTRPLTPSNRGADIPC
ncbi:MAG: class I SAM-dependent methyltransferase [Phycisphaerales bacterium]